MRSPLLLLLCLLAAAGCDAVAGVDGSPSMDPGQDCMQCHSARGQAADRSWSVAGTVFADPEARIDAGLQDAEILITDDAGTQLTLLSNEVGNFYTGETLVPPIHVEVQWGTHRMRMVEAPPIGSCNACHTSPTPAVAPVVDFSPAPGRLFVPTTPAGSQP